MLQIHKDTQQCLFGWCKCWQWMMKTGLHLHFVDTCTGLIHSFTSKWIKLKWSKRRRPLKGRNPSQDRPQLAASQKAWRGGLVHWMGPAITNTSEPVPVRENLLGLTPRDNLLLRGWIRRHFESALSRVLQQISLTADECALYLLKPPHEPRQPFPQGLP